MREAGDGPALSRLGDRPSLEPLLEGGRPWGGQAAGRPRPASRGWCLTTASRAARPAQHRTSALLPPRKPKLLPRQDAPASRPSSSFRSSPETSVWTPACQAPCREGPFCSESWCSVTSSRKSSQRLLLTVFSSAALAAFLSLVLRFMSTWWLGQGPMCWVSSSPGQRAGPEAEGPWVKQAGDAHPQGWALGFQGQPHPQRPL